MSKKLEGKIAVITGGNSGLGEGAARGLMAAFGLMFLVQNFVTWAWGGDLRGYDYLTEPVRFGDQHFEVVAYGPDGSRAAHFEHTVAVTDDGPEILTARP